VPAEEKPAARLWAMAHLGTPMAVRVAATLRIADHIAGGVRTVPGLAEAAGADARALDRLLRYLAARGILNRDQADRYSLTELGDALRDGHPAGIRAWLDIEGAGRAELSFVQLLHSVRTGKAAFPVQFGRSLWADLAADPAHARSFNASMGAEAANRADSIAAGYDWGSRKHVVDVGGGNGTLLIALLRRHPGLRGTVVDMPSTAAAARAAIAAAGLADRGEVAAGSFLEPLPEGGDAYLLSLVTHNWDDGGVRSILRRCAEAMVGQGAVFVVETFGADGESPATGMDLRMLAYTGGRERGVSELAALGADAGLRLVALHPAGPVSIAELALH
jgi:hypothetical protein